VLRHQLNVLQRRAPRRLEVAAAQFIDACQSTLFKPVLFNFAPPPTMDRIRHVVAIAVRAFIAAYRK
jgi:hypothetical protein